MYQTRFSISKDLFPPPVVLKAAYAFLDRAYIHIEDDHTNWIVNMRTKNPAEQADNNCQEFENELLSQAVRLITAKQTQSIREILLARAMASTLIDEKDPLEKIKADELDVSSNELDKILTNWFEQNE